MPWIKWVFLQISDGSLVSQYYLNDTSFYLHAEYKFGKPFGKKTMKSGSGTIFENYIYDDTYCAQIDISRAPENAFYTKQGKI